MSIIHLAEADSTNSWLKQHRGELSHGDAVTADIQTAGRGRMGHEWLSDSGMLPLSVLLRNVRYPQFVTLAAAVAVCHVLDSLYEHPQQFGIKWPNDIVLNGRKLCGILCESAAGRDGIDIICGVGLNLCQSEEYFLSAGLPFGGSLKMMTGIAPDREHVAEQLCEAITEHCSRDFPELIGEYRSRCVTTGKEVLLISETGERRAFAEGIADNGHLICRDDSGSFEVYSGEVSVRGLYGYV